MKKIWSGALAAALLTAGAVPAGAAETAETALPALRQDVQGEYAEVTDIQVKSGAYTVMTAKTGDSAVAAFCFTDGTAVMDTQTGEPVSESGIRAGDRVYVYYENEDTPETDPPQYDVQAVLVNLSEEAAPAHLLTAEAVTRNGDGSLTVQAQNGGLLLTVAADADVQPLTTKNRVTLADIRIGTRFFAWYDQVMLSEPGQAAAERIVIPAQQDSRFFITVEGDMALPEEGRYEDGAARVPVRAAAEALGYTVSWDGAWKTVTVSGKGRTLAFTIGEDSYSRYGADAAALGAAAYVENGVSWVPAELFLLLDEPAALTGGTLNLGAVQNSAPV